jgi:hypothetical protein
MLWQLMRIYGPQEKSQERKLLVVYMGSTYQVASRIAFYLPVPFVVFP